MTDVQGDEDPSAGRPSRPPATRVAQRIPSGRSARDRVNRLLRKLVEVLLFGRIAGGRVWRNSAKAVYWAATSRRNASACAKSRATWASITSRTWADARRGKAPPHFVSCLAHLTQSPPGEGSVASFPHMSRNCAAANTIRGAMLDPWAHAFRVERSLQSHLRRVSFSCHFHGISWHFSRVKKSRSQANVLEIGAAFDENRRRDGLPPRLAERMRPAAGGAWPASSPVWIGARRPPKRALR